jgi:hypothetical protein
VSIHYFPQLATGTICQFPSRKDTLERTVLNRTPGNTVVKMADPEAESTRWELAYGGLTDEEISRLEDLFIACEGRLRTFMFVDPFGNLLRWTEDLSNPVWESSMQTARSSEDPLDGMPGWRVVNAAQAPQIIAQSVDAPGWYRYAFSVWVRSESTQSIVLRLDNADGSLSVRRPVASNWERIVISGDIAGESDYVRCCIEVPAACAVDLYGPQLEAQIDASGYRKNTDLAGVYTARFDQDMFGCVSNGPDNHAVRLQVVTVRGVTS